MTHGRTAGDADARLWRWAMVATLLAAVVLRAYRLDAALWYDEIVTLVESARRPLLEIFVYFPDVNVHPLHSVLAHLSLASFGESAWALRVPAFLFGVASIAMTYVLGKRLIGRAEAWAGATMLAVSYQHIWFSQNARGYTMMGFFALLSTYFLMRALESQRTRDYSFYAVACAAGVYTHMTMGFVVAGHVAVLVTGKLAGWSAVRQQPLLPLIAAWGGATALSMLLYAPYAQNVLAHFGADKPKVAARIATSQWAVAEVLRNLFSGPGVAAAIGVGLAAVAGAFGFLRRKPLAFALLVVPAVVAAMAIVALGQPMRPRFFFFVAGAAAIFAGHGIGMAARVFSGSSRSFKAALVGVCAAFVVLSALGLPRNYRFPKQDFDAAVNYLDGLASGGAVVGAASAACWPIEHYYLKTDWPCVDTAGDLEKLLAAPGDVRVVFTLADYIDDPELQTRLRDACLEVRRFPGTLGGGDVVVCDPRRAALP